MAESADDIGAWPASPQALADIHLCPGCFTTITASLCPECGFALTDPRALQVLALGRGILASELERQRVIQEVRMDHWPAPVAAPVAVQLAQPEVISVPLPAPEPTPQPEPQPQPQLEVALSGAALLEAPDREPQPAAVPAEPRHEPSTPPRAPRRRLTVPVLLLIVGVSLVGIAAIFFLVYAWFTASIGVRALIIAGITAATIVIASFLRRRELTATAEGIAVLGVLLLALDAWAVRANDFFGAGSVQPALYAGIGMLAVGVLCRVWARFSHLRSPDIAAVLALPVGVGLVVGGLTSLPTGEAITAGLIGAAAGGLLHALPAPWSSARARADAIPERTTLAVVGVAALVLAALVAAVVSPESLALPLWSGPAIIVLGAAHAYLLRPRRDEEALPVAAVLAGTAAGTAAAVATAFGWQVALRADLPVYTLLLAPVVAVAVPVLLDRLRARVSGLGVALITAAALGGLSLIVTVVLWVLAAAGAMGAGWVSWQTDAFAAPAAQVDGAWFAAIASLIIAALLLLAPTLGKPPLSGARIIAATVVVLSGVAVVAVPALLVGVAILAAAVAVAALTRPALRVGGSVAAGVAAATAFAAGMATPWLWLVGVAVALAVPIVAQVIVRPTGGAAALLTLTPIGVATLSAFIAPYAVSAIVGAPLEWMITYVLLQWIALLAVLGAVVLPCVPASRTALAVSAYALLALSLWPFAKAAVGSLEGLSGQTITTPPEILGEPVLGIVRAVGLLALFALIALGRTRVTKAPALGAAALVAPTAAMATFAVLQTLGLEPHPARAIALVGAAVTVVWVAALWSMRSGPAGPVGVAAEPIDAVEVSAPAGGAPAVSPARTFSDILSIRALVDLGAVVTVLLLAGGVQTDLAWAMLTVIAAGFAGASVARGWAALASARTGGIPTTRAHGVALARAPRRLLAWPAFAAASLALWSGLSSSAHAASLTVEAYVLPPAVGLLVFAAVLVWLRRLDESAVAIGASFSLGLIVPAVVGWSGSPMRGIVVALVSAALCLVLTWTPALRARIPALTGATTALIALAVATMSQRATGDSPADAAWLLLLIGVAYASAVGAARPTGTANRRSLYATLVPPIALVAAVGAGIPSAAHQSSLTVALVVLAGLHFASAALDRDPFGAATRWTALTGAAAFAVAGYLFGAASIDGVAVVELVSLPIALIVLGGSALAQWRRRRRTIEGQDAEHIVWLIGLGLAVLPSLLAPVGPLRSWLGVIVPFAVALIAVLAPIGGARSLRSSSAFLLAVAALLMGIRAVVPAAVEFEFAELVAIVAGAGAILIAAAMIWRAAFPTDTPAASLTAAGATLLVAMTVLFGDGDLARSTATAIVAGLIGVGGAALLGLDRWRVFGAVLAVAGFAGAVVAVGARFIEVAGTASVSLEPDLWAAIGVAITAAIGIMALRATADSLIEGTVANIVGAAFAAALVLFALSEFVLLGYAADDRLRTVFTMSALTVAGVCGMLWRARLGLALPVAAATAAVAFGGGALLLHSVSPVELITVPPALGLVALGARSLRRNPQARTWRALGPGLALLTVPSLLHDFFDVDTELWRVVALGVVALGLVVIGAVWRLQAPLVLGSAVLLVHGIAQLWPWILSAYVYVPWWLWLGIGGAVLIFLAARYEKQMRALRTAFTAVMSLR